MIKASGLHKRFGRLHALRGVDLTVAKGEVLVILGPSGSGKSTLLRCLNLLERPDRGQVWLDGEELTAPRHDLHRLRADVGMVFQQFNLFPHLTALANVALAPYHVRSETQAAAFDRAKRLLARVGLGDRGHAYPGQLSGGQQQRVAIARALAMRPKAMLFDEPTSALDPEMIAEVLAVMEELAADGMTMVCVTHELGFARRAADRILFMADGEALEEGPPGELLDSPQLARTRTFLGKAL